MPPVRFLTVILQAVVVPWEVHLSLRYVNTSYLVAPLTADHVTVACSVPAVTLVITGLVESSLGTVTIL